MKTEIMTVTPEQAKIWLEKNDGNRRLSQDHIDYLSNEIKLNRWRLTHQGIAFDTNGNLRDGQHRLYAVIEANKPIKSQVTFDLPINRFPILDRGMARNMSTITGIDSDYTAIYSFLLSLHSAKMKSRPDDVVELDKNLRPYVSKLLDYCKANIRYYSSAPVKSAAIIRMIKDQTDQYILKTYKGLLTRTSRDLCPIADSFIRIAEAGKSSNVRINSLDTYCRAYRVFNSDLANCARLIITPTIKNQYLSESKEIVGKFLSMQKIPKS